MKVIDADAHVEESIQTWQFLPPEFHSRRPIPVTLPPDTQWGPWNAVWLIDQKVRQSAATPTTMEIAQRKRIAVPSQELTDVSAWPISTASASTDKSSTLPAGSRALPKTWSRRRRLRGATTSSWPRSAANPAAGF